jgi:hypothetical protein
MLGIAVPADEPKGTVFWSYAEPRTGGNGLAVARGVLVDGP